MKKLIIALLTAGLCAASLTACDELDLGGLADGTDTDASTVTEATEDTSGETDDSATEDTSGETDNSATEDTSGETDDSASEDTSGGNDDSASEGNTNQETEDDRLPAIDNVGTEHLKGEPITEREWEKIVMAKYDNYSYKWTVTQGGVTRISYGIVDGRRWMERAFENDVEIERRGEFSVGDDLLYFSYDFEDNTWEQENVGRTFNHPLNGVPFAFSDFTFDEATGTYTYRIPTDKTYSDEQIAAGAGTVALRFIDGESVFIATVDTDEAGNLNRMSFEFWSYGTTQVLTPETINPDAVLPPDSAGDSITDEIGTTSPRPPMPDHNENVKPDHPDNNGDVGKLPPDHSVDSGVHTESSPVPPEDTPMEDAKVESAPEAALPPSPPDDSVDTHKPVKPVEPPADEDEWLDLNGNGIPDAKE